MTVLRFPSLTLAVYIRLALLQSLDHGLALLSLGLSRLGQSKLTRFVPDR